jgi:hypothetical protein
LWSSATLFVFSLLTKLYRAIRLCVWQLVQALAHEACLLAGREQANSRVSDTSCHKALHFALLYQYATQVSLYRLSVIRTATSYSALSWLINQPVECVPPVEDVCHTVVNLRPGVASDNRHLVKLRASSQLKFTLLSALPKASPCAVAISNSSGVG